MVIGRGEGRPTDDEPMPALNDRVAIQDLVVADLQRRKKEGIAKYGTALQGFNGRNALNDLYQELIDALQYTRQLIYEADETRTVKIARAAVTAYYSMSRLSLTEDDDVLDLATERLSIAMDRLFREVGEER